MKQIALIILTFFTLASNGQTGTQKSAFLTVSPVIDKEKSPNKIIISALVKFLESKNASPSENEFWLGSDFQKYVFPYIDIYNIEQSKHGKDFFKPTLMEILPTENDNQKILKIAFIGHNPETNENLIKSVYNILANVESGKIIFSRFLDFTTQHWRKRKIGSINYIISPRKKIDYNEINQQEKEIGQLCMLFQTKPLDITYYSCINPKELFEIKGFDYNPMMYIDNSGGLADHGNIIFSGNNSEIYTHEIVHIYTNNLYPKINRFFDEGMATYIAGSGKFDYKWHRTKLKKFITQNPRYNFKNHLDPYERFYFENETSIPYLTSALICERIKRIYGKEKLLQILISGDEVWQALNNVGLTKENINEELIKEIKLPLTPIWQ